MDNVLAQEFDRRYRQTYACLNLDKKLLSVFVSEMVTDEDAGDHIVSYYTQNRGEIRTLDADTFYNAILPISHAKLFTYNGRLCYYYRIPHRQYRKGYCNDNTRVVDLVAKYVHEQTRSNDKYTNNLEVYPAFSQGLFAELHKEDYPLSLDKALAACVHGIAVSDEWGITLSCDTRYEFLLWRYGQMVAGISGNNIVTFGFQQEVRDFIFRFSEKTYEVIHANS